MRRDGKPRNQSAIRVTQGETEPGAPCYVLLPLFMPPESNSKPQLTVMVRPGPYPQGVAPTRTSTANAGSDASPSATDMTEKPIVSHLVR